MKKTLAVGLCALLLTAGAFADYDKDVSVKVMRQNAALLGQITSASNKGDFAQASEKLKLLGDEMKPLLSMTPPKGDKKEWDRILNAFIAATETGRAACEKSDGAALKVSLDEIRRVMQQGHKTFR